MRLIRYNRRRGSVLPLVVVSLVGLLGLVALAIDLGMIACARTQCQAAADAAALAGARALTGDPANDFNYANAATPARAAAASNNVFTDPVDPNTQLILEIGSYRFDETQNRFVIDPTGRNPGDAWSLVRATVSATHPALFSRVFNLIPASAGGPATPLTTLGASAVATAAHRPRDVGVIIDFSGSMRLDSLLGAPVTDSTGLAIANRDRAMNPETVYPTWGHWTNVNSWRGSTAAVPFLTASGEKIGQSNTVADIDAGVAIVKDFFQDGTPFGSSTPAFTSWADSYGTTATPDAPPRVASSSNWAINTNEIIARTASSSSTTLASSSSGFYDDRTNGTTSAGYGSSFAGYTYGPRYWGKTFYQWPPDPRGASTPNDVTGNNDAKDWRQRFFIQLYIGAQTSTSTTGGGGGGGGSPPPPPPPLNVVPEAKPGDKLFFQTGGTLLPGAKLPMVNNALMWNGGTDLTLTTTSGNGAFRTPGSITSFRMSTSSVTNPDSTVTTTNINQRFTYQINYAAILKWLKESGDNPFPPRLRAGGVLYYDSIPDTIPTNVHPLPTTTQAQRDQRFWKEFIDEVLGVAQTGFSTTNGVTYATYSNVAGRTGYGDYFSWPSKTTGVWGSARGLENVTPQPSLAKWQVADPTYDARFQDYRDNPRRPRVQFWFGPMAMVDFLGNMNRGRWWLPGTAHESPMWQCKAGVTAAINDIKVNHPNDLVSLISFSKPAGYSPSTGSTLQSGTYNSVRSPLGRDYNRMINALYFPTIVAQTNQEIHPYHSDISDVPRAIGGTCYAMGLMLAYNQFSRGNAPGDLRTFATAPAPLGQAGGLGRPGAQKLIVFETDGVCSATAYSPGGMNAVFTDAGPHKSYFRVRYDKSGSPANEYPPYLASGATDAATQAAEVAQRICAPETGTGSGYSSSRKPVRIHCIAFGSLFEGGAADAGTALATMQNLQYIGGVQSSPSTPLSTEKIITGTSTERINKLKTAFRKIMQDGYSVTLIE